MKIDCSNGFSFESRRGSREGGRGWRGDKGSRQERIGRRQQFQHELEERQFLPKPLQAQFFLCVVTFTSLRVNALCTLRQKQSRYYNSFLTSRLNGTFYKQTHLFPQHSLYFPWFFPLFFIPVVDLLLIMHYQQEHTTIV